MSRNTAGNSGIVSIGSTYVDIPPDSPPETFYIITYNQGTDSEGEVCWHDELDGNGEPVDDFKRTYQLNFEDVERSFPMAFRLDVKGPNPPLPAPTFTVTGAVEKDTVDGETSKPYTAFYMTDSITDSTEVLVEDDLKTVYVSSPSTEFYRRWSLGRVSRAEPVAITSSELIEIDDMKYALVVPLSAGGDYLSSIDPDTSKPVYNKSLKALYLHKPDEMKVTLSWEPASAVRVWHTPFKARTDGSSYFNGEIQNGHVFYEKDDENPVFIEIVEFQNTKLRWGIGDRYHEIDLIPVDVENLRGQNITDAFEVSNIVTSQSLDAQVSSSGDLRTYRLKLPTDIGSSAMMRFEIYEDGSLVDRNENENGELPISSKTEDGNTFYATDNFRFVTWDTDDAHAGNQTIKVKLGDTVRMTLVVDGSDLTYFELPIGLPPSEGSTKAIRTVDTRFVKLNYGSVVADTSVLTVIDRKNQVWAQGAIRFNNIEEVPKDPVKNMIAVKGIATGSGGIDLLVESNSGGSPSGFFVSVNLTLTPGTTPNSYHIAQQIAAAINAVEGRDIATAHNTYPSAIEDGITTTASAYAHVLIDEGQEVIYNSLTVSNDSIPNVSVFIPTSGIPTGYARNMHDVAMLALNFDDENENTMDVFVVDDLSRGSQNLDGIAFPHYYLSGDSPIVGGYCIRGAKVKDDGANLFVAAHEAGHVLLNFGHSDQSGQLMEEEIDSVDSIEATKRISYNRLDVLRDSENPAAGMMQQK